MDEPASAAKKNMIIVGVDDNPEALELLGRVVGRGGYTFFGAESGTACVSLVARVVPRLILLDIEMTDMDGFETCRRLRTDSHLSHVPIAFLTARQSAEDVRAGMAAGGNDFVVKPFDNAKLIERVTYWTRHRINKSW